MITVDNYVSLQKVGAKFVITKENLQTTSEQEFHDAVAPYAIALGGRDFVVTDEPRRESMTGSRLYSFLYCMRTL